MARRADPAGRHRAPRVTALVAGYPLAPTPGRRPSDVVPTGGVR
jgi:hypothetical protein